MIELAIFIFVYTLPALYWLCTAHMSKADVPTLSALFNGLLVRALVAGLFSLAYHVYTLA